MPAARNSKRKKARETPCGEAITALREKAGLTVDAVTMGRIRGLISAGDGLPLDQAMAKETQVFDEHIAQVSASDVAAGRDRATARGRQMADAKRKD